MMLFELQLIVTGMHLSPEFGLTYREIEKAGFKIDKKIEIFFLQTQKSVFQNQWAWPN